MFRLIPAHHNVTQHINIMMPNIEWRVPKKCERLGSEAVVAIKGMARAVIEMAAIDGSITLTMLTNTYGMNANMYGSATVFSRITLWYG